MLSHMPCCSALRPPRRAGRARGTDAVECLHAGGGLRNDVKDLGTEGLHQCAGKMGTNTFAHAGTQVWLNAFECGGRDSTRRCAVFNCKPWMRSVIHQSMALDILPGRDRWRGRASHRDEAAVSTWTLTRSMQKPTLRCGKVTRSDAAGELFQGYVQGVLMR